VVRRMTAKRKVTGSNLVNDGLQPAPYLLAIVDTWGGFLGKVFTGE